MFARKGYVLALLALLGLSTTINATLNFSSRESRIIAGSTAQFLVRSAISNFNGTLEISDVDATGNRIAGTANIAFEDGILETNYSASCSMQARFTGAYNRADGDTITLAGDAAATPDRLRFEAGASIPAINVTTAYNRIEGSPIFTDESVIAIAASSAVELAITTKFNSTITFAAASGVVTLIDSLYLDDAAVIAGDGKIDINGKSLHLQGKETSWATDLVFTNAGDIELHSKTTLSGTWYFSDTSGDDATVNGNGNILEFGAGGIIHVEQGVGLALTDVVVRNLGDSASYGQFIMDDGTATIKLSNTSLLLSENISWTMGAMLVHGSDCTIVTAGYTLGFDSKMGLSVDNVTLWYDTLSSGDEKNIKYTPSGGSETDYADDGAHINYENNGVIRCAVAGAEDSISYSSSSTMTKNEVISSSRTMTFSAAATLTGGGYAIEWARGSSGANAMVLGANAVTLTGVVLKNFHTAGVSGIANLSIGDDVSIELAADESITTAWNFTGSSTASTIYGKGCKLTLGVANALNISNGVTLNLQDVKVAGITPTNDIEIACAAGTYSTSKLVLKDTQLEFAGEYPFAEASIDISGDCLFGGRTAAASFGLRTSGTMTILADSTLTIDRNFTFTYEGRPIAGSSNANGMEKIVFTNAVTSRLYLNGCEFRTSTTGAKLSGGRLVIDDKVTFSSGAHHDASALKIDTDLTVEILAGAVLDMYGYIEYAA
ncbi:hypothetical protein HOD08_04605 [bacterium]|nr:hypothetical protein [bacterium]